MYFQKYIFEAVRLGKDALIAIYGGFDLFSS